MCRLCGKSGLDSSLVNADTACKDGFRYDIGSYSAPGRLIPRETWQYISYIELMGYAPPDAQHEQFDYNPRTKAGKALLERLVAEEEAS